MIKKKWTILLTFAVVAILSFGFGKAYFDDHAWGAWGDDSAGYIYLAGRMYAEKPLVYVDELGKRGLDFFKDEKLARWLLPTHHGFINPNGMAASKYPMGASMLMVWTAKAFGSADYFYLANPLTAVASVVLLYLFCVLFFAQYRWRHVVGLLAAVMLGASEMFYDFAISQPMREVPSIAFLLLTGVLMLLSMQLLKTKKKAAGYTLLFLAGLAFGMGVHVRETSIVTVPAFVLLFSSAYWQKTKTPFQNVRTVLPYAATFAIAFIIAMIPFIQNVTTISQNKVVFKARDTSSIVLLPNMNHLQTFSLQNAFDNQGKFRPGSGAIPQYWKAMQNASPAPFFLGAVVLGLVYLWRESRVKAGFLLLWFVSIFGLFSFWINPYSRYILPTFPVLMILGSYGMVVFVDRFLPLLFKRRVIRVIGSLALVVGLIAAYQPVFATIHTNIVASEIHRFKAISRNDLHQLIDLGNELKAAQDKPLLMFSGDWQYGTSETLEAHTFLKTVRFPLEQKFDFKNGDVNTFVDQMIDDGYDLYFWIDTTSSPGAAEWLKRFGTEEVKRMQLTFEPDIHIYHIISHP